MKPKGVLYALILMSWGLVAIANSAEKAVGWSRLACMEIQLMAGVCIGIALTLAFRKE